MKTNSIKLMSQVLEESEKSPKWKLSRHVVDDDLTLYHSSGDNEGKRVVNISIPKGIIYFQFNSGGSCELQFGPHYSQNLGSSETMLLYNPSMDLNFTCILSPGANSAFIVTTIQLLHDRLVGSENEIGFLNEGNVSSKHYVKLPLSSSLKLSLDQLFSMNVNDVARGLFLTGKTFELLGHYFQREERADYVERCPFLKDQRNVEAVRKSRQLLIERMNDAPTIKELSLEVGLNEHQLKEGFKNIYGNSIKAYLQDYRVRYAMKLMTDDGLKVQEAAAEIGYSNVSHFISAFKKKYGITPKQFLKE